MNQLIKEEDNDSIKEYVYDRKGRVISDGIKEYYYNENNKLSKVKTNESEVSYKYDGLNNLVARQVEDKQNHYVINPLAAYNNILEVSNQDTSKRYTYDGLGIHSINNNETLLDHLGSTTSIISNDNITKLDYDEFGNSLENNNSYTGYLYDEVSQLNYAQARFYDSRIGRFISEDNIVNTDIVLKGFNRYNYVESNPIKYVDRDGNFINIAIGTGIGAVFGGIVGGVKAWKSGGDLKDIILGVAGGSAVGAVSGAAISSGAALIAASGSAATLGGSVIMSASGTGLVAGGIDSGANYILDKPITPKSVFTSYTSGFAAGLIPGGQVLFGVKSIFSTALAGIPKGAMGLGMSNVLNAIFDGKSPKEILDELLEGVGFGSVLGYFTAFSGFGTLISDLYGYILEKGVDCFVSE